MAILTVEMAQHGRITVPETLCEQHKWGIGQQFSVLDLNGVIMMSPKESKVDSLANQLRDDLLREGATLEEMLIELRCIREAEGRRPSSL